MITVRRGIICGGISSASERWAPNDAGETSPVKFCQGGREDELAVVIFKISDEHPEI